MCIRDRYSTYFIKHIINNKHGGMFQLAGWGFTEHYKLSDVLLLVDLPYVDHFHCINQVPPATQRWVTSDQFCGGYTNGKVST